jgi:hypothetical protein
MAACEVPEGRAIAKDRIPFLASYTGILSLLFTQEGGISQQAKGLKSAFFIKPYSEYLRNNTIRLLKGWAI